MKIVTSPVQGENVLIPRYLGDFSRLLRRIKRTSPGDLSDQFMLAKISSFISRSNVGPPQRLQKTKEKRKLYKMYEKWWYETWRRISRTIIGRTFSRGNQLRFYEALERWNRLSLFLHLAVIFIYRLINF